LTLFLPSFYTIAAFKAETGIFFSLAVFKSVTMSNLKVEGLDSKCQELLAVLNNEFKTQQVSYLDKTKP